MNLMFEKSMFERQELYQNNFINLTLMELI